MNNQGEKQENAKETSNAVVEKLLNSRSLIISGEINSSNTIINIARNGR